MPDDSNRNNFAKVVHRPQLPIEIRLFQKQISKLNRLRTISFFCTVLGLTFLSEFVSLDQLPFQSPPKGALIFIYYPEV